VIEFMGGYGVTPLGVASSFGHARCAQLLIDAGAKLEAKDEHGRTPLYRAVCNDRLAVASTLLANGALVDSARQNGYTPLMSAAENGRSEMVRLLLDAGADKDLVNICDMTALEIAIMNNQAEVVTVFNERAIIERGRVVDNSGIYMPEELAELCGDYVHMTPERHAIQARQERK
jgi:ankyrin repeat protein